MGLGQGDEGVAFGLCEAVVYDGGVEAGEFWEVGLGEVDVCFGYFGGDGAALEEGMSYGSNGFLILLVLLVL